MCSSHIFTHFAITKKNAKTNSPLLCRFSTLSCFIFLIFFSFFFTVFTTARKFLCFRFLLLQLLFFFFHCISHFADFHFLFVMFFFYFISFLLFSRSFFSVHRFNVSKIIFSFFFQLFFFLLIVFGTASDEKKINTTIFERQSSSVE